MATVNYEEVMAIIKTLPPVEMKEVKDFAEFLKGRKRPAAKKSFTEFCGIIDKKDIEIMKASIEEGCERIDANEW